MTGLTIEALNAYGNNSGLCVLVGSFMLIGLSCIIYKIKG